MASARPIALSIAGSDPSGGAGIQADLKTFHQHGVYGAAVVSLLTVQNTQCVGAVQVVDAALLGAQLDAVLEDLTVAAVKTGALGSAENVRAVAERMREHSLPLVVDPVRIASHGAALLDDDARAAVLDALLPCATLVTPNASEAQWLTGLPVQTLRDARRAAQALLDHGARAVLLKGGHLDERDAVDLLADRDGVVELRGPRVAGAVAHGLGCALSAAIAARLALGELPGAACAHAKRWLHVALERAPRVGHGRAPIDHFAAISSDSDATDHVR